MAKILVNYLYHKEKDEFEIQKGPYVFADMKVAVLETEDDVRVPLVVPIQNVMTVVDRSVYEQTNKKFYLAADEDGKVLEHPNGVEIWLPKDTDISKLRFINGRLVMVQPEENEAESEPKSIKRQEKPKAKKH